VPLNVGRILRLDQESRQSKSRDPLTNRNLEKRTSLAAEGAVCGGFKRDNELLVQKLTAEDFRVLQVHPLLAVGDFRRFESLQ
jgi:hypothetical protein